MAKCRLKNAHAVFGLVLRDPETFDVNDEIGIGLDENQSFRSVIQLDVGLLDLKEH